jgi:shikimate 5-dehydrogenase
MSKYQPATQPTLYFIGVTTGKSSIMKVFPAWAEYLGLKDMMTRKLTAKRLSSSATTHYPWARLSPRTKSIFSMPAAICSM